MSDVVLLKSRAVLQGGLEKYTTHLAKAFVQKGLEVTLLTTGKCPEIEGVRVISLAKDTSFTWLHLRRFDVLCKKWLLEHSYRIVFGMERTSSQTHYRAGSGVHAVYLARRKLIDPFWKRVTFPINPMHRCLLALEKQAFESPGLKKLFANSEMVKKEILSLYATPAQKIEVVHNGVEWQAWEQDFAKSFNTLRPSQPYHFLFVGNGYQRKGLSFLLHGLSRLPSGSFLLTVIGKDKNPLVYAKMADSLGIKEKITFLGPQTDIRPFYQEADALVIPSIYDPFANVTVEALAMGLFVVTSRYNGGREVLNEESGAIIENLTDPMSVAEALIKALSRSKDSVRALQIRNSVKHLDFSNQLDKIVRLTLT